MNQQRIAALFILCQQHKDRAWRAHIARNHRAALEQATLLQLHATDLMRALAPASERSAPAPLVDDPEGRN